MLIKGITDEDFVNYRVPSMFIATNECTFKCDKEYGEPICQNSSLVRAKTYDVKIEDLVRRYLSNDITKAVVFGGLEPFDQYIEIYDFISMLRYQHECLDPVVIYTGYNESEIDGKVKFLSVIPNIIVKFGRFIPGDQKHFDEVLGVDLASDNQYARQIS